MNNPLILLKKSEPIRSMFVFLATELNTPAIETQRRANRIELCDAAVSQNALQSIYNLSIDRAIVSDVALMGIHFAWDDPAQQAIILFTIQKPWTWEELDEAIDGAFALLAQQPHPVGNIVDMTHGNSLPPGNPMPHLRQVYRLMPANMTASVVVGASPTIRLFVTTFTSIYPRAKSLAHFTDTMDEARATIKRHLEGAKTVAP